MIEHSEIVMEAIRELVVANRILANEGVVDALGDVSMRHPQDARRYLLSCSRSPALVTDEDIMEYTLDNRPIDQRHLNMYAERPIHGCLYRARADVNTVCHSHARQIIPFTVTRETIRPVWVMGATIGNEVPIWDIREDL